MRKSFLDSVQAYVASSSDFLEQQKRLREARMRWIEENEAPRDYIVSTIDRNGDTHVFETPFQLGQITYEDDWTEAMQEPRACYDHAASDLLLGGVAGVFTEDKMVRILLDGEEQHAFLPDESSPHPAIEANESYGDYYKRVSAAYNQQRQGSSGRPDPSPDALRKPAGDDPAGKR
jgi:hypothetical protein